MIPTPHPPAPPVELTHLSASIDDAVRAILRRVPPTADPADVRLALAAAGLNLPPALVESWLDRIHPAEGTDHA